MNNNSTSGTEPSEVKADQGGSTKTTHTTLGGPGFASLQAQKRGDHPNNDLGRRNSLSDQHPKAGFIGGLWQKYVTGQGPPQS